ncbi:MAG: acyl carrier protein [Acidobacteria bacterium]|nr:MAG: acyl carrier protein [Acidobacteriota bacterium]
MSDDVFAAVARLLREELDLAGELRPEMRLVEDLELDSIRLLTLATAVEDRFFICLDEADEEAIVTLGDLVAVIAARRGGRDGE